MDSNTPFNLMFLIKVCKVNYLNIFKKNSFTVGTNTINELIKMINDKYKFNLYGF